MITGTCTIFITCTVWVVRLFDKVDTIGNDVVQMKKDIKDIKSAVYGDTAVAKVHMDFQPIN